MPKRSDYISWDEFFIGEAKLASKRSKDPSTRCGACIVDKSINKIVGTGYNGLARGLNDDGFSTLNGDSWGLPLESFPKDGTVYDYWSKPDKYHFVVHAEKNAILNSSCSLRGCVMYLYSDRGYYPCSDCAQMIVQVGIQEVVMDFAIKENTPEYNWGFTKHMFRMAGVKIRILNKEKTE